jgi:anti-sigma B factor antagonist
MFEIKLLDDVLVLSGRFDASRVEEAERLLVALASSTTADLSALDYISSAGIGALVKAQKRLHARGQALRLTRLQPRVRDVFHYAGLEGLFGIE